MRGPRLLALLGVASLALAYASSAQAADPAAAQALFDSGKRLMSSHEFARACAAFAESQKLDPGVGTLFHLADCQERMGKTASSWAAFMEVESEARALGEASREAAARDRASALLPKVARLVIEPGAERATPGLVLTRDGETIGAGQWAIDVPVDPGDHVVEAHAPGKGAWRTTVTVAEGARALVTVPLLADAPAVAEGADVPGGHDGTAVATTRTTSGEELTAPRHRGNGQRVAGAVIGAAGIAGLGVGTYFGVASLVHHHDSLTHCNGNVCDPTGVSLRDEANRQETGAIVALSAGGAALVAGIVTYVTAPRTHEASSSTAGRPVVAVGPGSVSVSGTW